MVPSPTALDSGRTEQVVDLGQHHFGFVRFPVLRSFWGRESRRPRVATFCWVNGMSSKSIARLALSLLLCLGVGTLEGPVTRRRFQPGTPDLQSHPGRRRRWHFRSPGPFSIF